MTLSRILQIRLYLSLMTCLVLTACATQNIPTQPIPELANTKPFVPEDVDLLALSPEMKAFVDRHIRRGAGEESRAWDLAYAALDPYLLDYEYDPTITLGAIESFARAEGNCLTFSHMFVAMARYAGLRAWYQEVRLMPQWSSENDTALVSMHVNAAVRDRTQEFVIDVSRRERKFTEFTRRMSDEEAKAHHFSNLGAEALLVDDLRRAYGYFRRALEIQPDLAFVWSNLGVALNRNGQRSAAQQAYHTALLYDPDHSVSLNNLLFIYEEAGDTERVEEIAKRVDHLRRRNPYYINYLAKSAISEQLYDDAIALSQRAIRIEGREYEFHYTLAQSLFLSGDESKARSSLKRARELAPSSKQANALRLPVEH